MTSQALSQDRMDIQDLTLSLARDTKNAATTLAQTDDETIDKALALLQDNLKTRQGDIIAANAEDLEAGADTLTEAKRDRLTLTPERIKAIIAAVLIVRDLPNPNGHVTWEQERPNGLTIQRVSVPLGTLGMIYEARPNVTIDAAALALKSRNSILLRGGSESLESCRILHEIIQQSLEQVGLPKACVSLIPVKDRAAVGVMLGAHQHIDVMIPRGGESLTSRVMNEAKMPVFAHLDGICHIYIHASARPEIAREVSLNAKMRRTGICGAMETLLLDKDLEPAIAKDTLTALLDAGCEIVGDKMAQALDPRVGPASSQDWDTEYLAPKLSVCVVNSPDEAISHINTHGSHHTDSILAEDAGVTQKFLNEVDSAIVMHNASTQFADGGEFGMGAEIGIATGRFHARGPVGLEQLTTYKYIVRGSGQTRPA